MSLEYAVLARRAALALALFELTTFALSQDAFGDLGPWGHLAVWTTSLAFFGLVFLALTMLPARLPLRRLILGYLLVQFAVQLWFNVEVFRSVFGAACGLLALGAGAAVLAGRIPGLDRALRLVIPVSWVVSGVSLPVWVLQEDPVRVLPPPAKTAEGPNIVLVSLDTVRADVLPAWGGTGLQTPTLEALAAEGVLFDDAVASTPITGPSHASMLTGLYPPSHGLRSNLTHSVSEEAVSVAEVLRGEGYATGAFVSAYPLQGYLGFARGFQVYDDRLHRGGLERIRDIGKRNFAWALLATAFMGGRTEAAIDGKTVNRRALRWLDTVEDRPYFLWVHYYDAHGPHDPPEPYRSRALEAADTARPRPADPALSEAMALYRAEIAYVDALVGEVIERTRARDPALENTLILLTADHGECFGEGGIEMNHVSSLYEATQHVPMIARFPGAAHAGTRESTTVSHLDLAPTILAAAGATMDQPLLGVDLASVVEGDAQGVRDRGIYLESWQYRPNGRELELKAGLRAEEWKLVTELGGPTVLWEYRSSEEKDRSEEKPQVLAHLQSRLEELLKAIPEATGTERGVSADEQMAIDQLGYGDTDTP